MCGLAVSASAFPTLWWDYLLTYRYVLNGVKTTRRLSLDLCFVARSLLCWIFALYFLLVEWFSGMKDWLCYASFHALVNDRKHCIIVAISVSLHVLWKAFIEESIEKALVSRESKCKSSKNPSCMWSIRKGQLRSCFCRLEVVRISSTIFLQPDSNWFVPFGFFFSSLVHFLILHRVLFVSCHWFYCH